MSIPIFEDFLYPFLYSVSQIDMTTKEVKKALIDFFNLSEDDCELRTRSGNITQFNDRINWTRQYLRRAGLIELPSRGVYRISARGKEYLATHTDLRKKDLMKFSEFASYVKGPTEAVNVLSPNLHSCSTELEITPTEKLDVAYSSINKDLATELLQKVLEQTPIFFEHLVLDLLRAMGYGTSAQATPFVHDDGIDGIIYEDQLGLGRIYVQAKRYVAGNNVGRPAVQQFSGALDGRHATKGIFITTSDYTEEAKSYVRTLPKSIVLINGEDLAQFMIEYNIGVSVKKVYKLKRIDTDYFEE